MTKYLGATHERKFDYIYLLVTRYDNSIKRLCKTMGIPKVEVEAWKNEMLEEVNTFIANRFPKTEDNNEDLELMILEKLRTAVKIETDPSKLARTLEIIKNYNVENKGNGMRKEDDDIINAIKKL